MAIREETIVEFVSSLPLEAGRHGLTQAFGVFLTHHCADYYNRVVFAVARAMEGSGLEADARALFVEAGHVCAFNTLGGVMQSAEWDAVIEPMIESREDRVRAVIAVINGLGWGVWTLDSIEPGKLARVSIRNSYEAAGWTRDYGRSEVPRCYLAAGVLAGVMNLVYVAEVDRSFDRTHSSYENLFRAGRPFRSAELSCTAAGAGACVVEAVRGPVLGR